MPGPNGGRRLGAGLPKGFKFSPEAIQRRIARIRFDEMMEKLEATILAGPKDEMSTQQISAFGMLLDRMAPRLSATELSGEVARPTVIRAPDVSADSKAWLDQHAPAVVSVDTPKPGDVH